MTDQEPRPGFEASETQAIPADEPALSSEGIADVIKATDFSSLSPEARAGIAEVGNSLDQHNQFLIKTSIDIFKHTSDVANAGTAIYEKLIVLNGGTIALSITLLGALSSRLTAAHISTKPHLWMISTSWSMLLFSIYCCYQVITARHSGLHGILNTLITERTRYNYSRLAEFLTKTAPLLKVNVPTEGGKSEATEVFKRLAQEIKAEGDDSLLKSAEKTRTMLAGSSRESIFARFAIWSTILAVALLCVFTIRSLGLFF